MAAFGSKSLKAPPGVDSEQNVKSSSGPFLPLKVPTVRAVDPKFSLRAPRVNSAGAIRVASQHSTATRVRSSPRADMPERQRPLIRQIPVQSGRAHMRTIKVLGVPDDEPVVERITRGRFKKLPPAMQEEWCKASMKTLQELMPKTDPDGIEKFFSPEKKDLSPAPAAAACEAGPSDLGSAAAGTKQGNKKRSAKLLGFPETPEGMLDSERDGKIAGMYVDTPPRRSKKPVPGYIG